MCGFRGVRAFGLLTLAVPGYLAAQVAPPPTDPVQREQPLTAGSSSNAIPNAPGIRVDGGRYDPQRSTVTAVRGGSVGATSASGVTVRSTNNDFDGIHASGPGPAFLLSNASIALSGNVGRTLSGPTGAIASDRATLILRKVDITTGGLVSSATAALGGATLKVYDSTLRATGGTLPAGYIRTIGPGSLEPPAPLGISGTARTHLATSGSRSYFYRSRIIADGWGALSTDMALGFVYLEANDCDIQAIRSGYGVYADVGARVVVNRSRIAAATYTAILASRATLVLNDTQSVSRGNVVMVHNVDLPPGAGSAFWGGRIELNGGTHRSSGTALLVKSANVDIAIDRAAVTAGDGVLLQSVVNPDAFSAKVAGRPVSGITLRVADSAISGDVIHEDGERPMSLALQRASLRGAIRGASLTLDRTSRWTATGDSQVVFAGPIERARIDAPAGVTIRAQAGESGIPARSYRLRGGGTLVVAGDGI